MTPGRASAVATGLGGAEGEADGEADGGDAVGIADELGTGDAAAVQPANARVAARTAPDRARVLGMRVLDPVIAGVLVAT